MKANFKVKAPIEKLNSKRFLISHSFSDAFAMLRLYTCFYVLHTYVIGWSQDPMRQIPVFIPYQFHKEESTTVREMIYFILSFSFRVESVMKMNGCINNFSMNSKWFQLIKAEIGCFFVKPVVFSRFKKIKKRILVFKKLLAKKLYVQWLGWNLRNTATSF